MIALSELSELQEIDLRLDVVRRERDSRVAQTGENPLMVRLCAEEGAEREILGDIRGRRKELELGTESARAKIEIEDGKLYGGEVKDPKELSNLQAEIFALRRALKSDEDGVLVLIGQEEEAQTATTHLEKLIEGASTTWAAQQEELKKEIAELEKQMAEIEAEVGEARAKIEATGLDVYDTQRLLMPIVIARVLGGACSGCRLTLPIYAVNRARRAEEPVRCPSCQRILYVA